MARKKKSPKPPPEEEQSSAGTATETDEATGTEASNGDQKPTLEELTEVEKARLEEELANKMDFLDQAIDELKSARQVYKDCRKEADERRAAVHQTNRSLRELLRGNWRPPKPDPQKKFDYPDDQSPESGTTVPDPEPEADNFWKSKPVTELGLSKTLVTKLENEGYTTLGVIVAELEEGQKFANLDFTDRQISSIQSAVHKHRPKTPEPPQEDEGNVQDQESNQE